MDNYRFRFRKKDWSDFDEQEMLDKLDKLKESAPSDLSPDEFASELGMTREEVIEFLMHKVETNGFLYKGLKLITSFEFMGFDQKELSYLSNHLNELMAVLKSSYDGPDFDEAIEIYGEDAIEESAMNHIFVPIVSGKDPDSPYQKVVEELLAFLIEAELTDGQIEFAAAMPEVFADWIREHMDFPEK